MKEYVIRFALFLLVCLPAMTFPEEIVYETSDLLNLAKRSGNLQDAYFKNSFLDPDLAEVDRNLTVKHLLEKYVSKDLAFFVPTVELKMQGQAIDGFQLRTTGGIYSTSLKQGLAALNVRLFPFIQDPEGGDILRLDLNYLGDYVGIYKAFNILNWDGENTTGTEQIGSKIYNNLYALKALTPWFTAHGGIIQNVVISNLHMQTEGTQESSRVFFGGDAFDFFFADFRLHGGTLEYFDFAFNLERVMDWLDIKLPFYLNFITGLADYNYYGALADNLRGLASGDLRLYFNPQIGFLPYALVTAYLDWQPNVGHLDTSQFRGGDVAAKLYLPIYVKVSDTNRNYVKISKPSEEEGLPDVLIGIGFSGGMSFYSDPALVCYGAPSTTVSGFFISPILRLNWIILAVTVEYRYNFNYLDSLSQYVESFNKPVHQLYIKAEI